MRHVFLAREESDKRTTLERHVIADRFLVSSYPTYVLVDHEGIIRYRQQGWNPDVDGEIDSEIRSLVKKAKAAQQQ